MIGWLSCISALECERYQGSTPFSTASADHLTPQLIVRPIGTPAHAVRSLVLTPRSDRRASDAFVDHEISRVALIVDMQTVLFL